MIEFAEEKIERLISISKQKPLLPEEFVPWHEKPSSTQKFLPEDLVSLEGDPLYNTLTQQQKLDLGRHEIVQTMYSYAWTESLACLFFTRHLLTISDTTSAEYRFLVRELIEEFRHQSMFSEAVMSIDGQPIPPSKLHKFIGNLTVNWLPADFVFMSVLAIEEIADTYGKRIRKDDSIYLVLRKVSELHHIEEGRHIHYTKMWLDRFTSNAGVVKRTLYSMIVAINVLFLRTLYVKEEIFQRLGVSDPKHFYKIAKKNYKEKFVNLCMDSVVKYVNEFNGFNVFTRFFWKWALGANISKNGNLIKS